MKSTITLSTGQQFQTDSDESILDAALRAGLYLPHGCKGGICGSCKAKVLSGRVRRGTYSRSAISLKEEESGWFLLCSSYAMEDVNLELCIAPEQATIASQLPVRIASIEYLRSDIAVVVLQLPGTSDFFYRPGQHIDLLLEGGVRRSYSIACAPSKSRGFLELHLRHMPGGLFTDRIFSGVPPAVVVRSVLRIEGPLGDFFWRQEGKPTILVAGGTGFAPMKAIIQHLISLEFSQSVFLYWGARSFQDLYQNELCLEWAHSFSNFSYHPVISGSVNQSEWTGLTGFVHEAVLSDFPDLSSYQVYVCGAPSMVEASRRDFVGLGGLPADSFFSDIFWDAKNISVEASLE